ncbi:hypothetical protein vseg_012710 [Gypsophila vaccaria]
MDIEKQQMGRRHNYGNLEEQSLTSWYMIQQQYNEQVVLDINIDLLNIIAERDAAIEERDQAFLEKEKALEDRQVAIAQRNLAIKECNDAVLERDNAFLTLQQQSMIELIGFGEQAPRKRLKQDNTAYLKSEMGVLDVLCKTMASSECSESSLAKRGYNCPSVRPRKRKPTGDESKRKVVPVSDNMNLKNDWSRQNLGLNKIDFNDSIVPVPGCSCTGTFRHCYKWGNGGWQSCCCTNNISSFPLPLKPNKRYGRKGGRKMTGSVFSKLLNRLAIEGYDISRPVDLKEHWSKHGTNRYITIK